MPRELVDLIVSYLDKKDLATCTMLSHHWRVSALPGLFHTLVIRPDHPLNFEPFQHFLTSASQATSYTKSLTLNHDEYRYRFPPITDLNMFALDLILSKLPALEALKLSGLRLQCCPSSIRPVGWSSPRSMKKLTLEHVDIPSPSWLSTHSDQTEIERLATKKPVTCSFVDLLNFFGSVQTLEPENVPVSVGRDYHYLIGAY